MGDVVEHNCAVYAGRRLHDAYTGLKLQKHRGPECFGIFAVGDNRIDAVKGVGSVEDFKLDRLEQIFPADQYHTFVGHSRYATKGKGDILDGAHPHTIGGTLHDFKSHVVIRDVEAALVHNGQIDLTYLPVDQKQLKSGSDSEAALHYLVKGGINEVGFLRQVPGSYTLVYAEKRRREVMVLRDRFGMMPGMLGKKDGKFGVASEDIAFTYDGGVFIEDLIPGSVYYLHPSGEWSWNPAVEQKNFAHCFFQWNYVGSPKSAIEGVLVRTIRVGLGAKLAEEFPIPDADFVTFIPDSPEFAARAYARQVGVEFKTFLSKEKNERSFLERTPVRRRKSIDKNLHVLDQERDHIKGARLILIDDSTIRGNNCIKARDLLMNAGAAHITLLNYTPMIGRLGPDGERHGCLYGVDMPPTQSFIVREVKKEKRRIVSERNKTLEEISSELAMDVRFLSTRGMLSVFEKYGVMPNDLCTFCIGGPRPFK